MGRLSLISAQEQHCAITPTLRAARKPNCKASKSVGEKKLRRQQKTIRGDDAKSIPSETQTSQSRLFFFFFYLRCNNTGSTCCQHTSRHSSFTSLKVFAPALFNTSTFSFFLSPLLAGKHALQNFCDAHLQSWVKLM